jgi:hypothetical protein
LLVQRHAIVLDDGKRPTAINDGEVRAMNDRPTDDITSRRWFAAY